MSDPPQGESTELDLHLPPEIVQSCTRKILGELEVRQAHLQPDQESLVRRVIDDHLTTLFRDFKIVETSTVRDAAVCVYRPAGVWHPDDMQPIFRLLGGVLPEGCVLMLLQPGQGFDTLDEEQLRQAGLQRVAPEPQGQREYVDRRTRMDNDKKG